MAIPCGWLAREMELARRQKVIVEMIRSHDGFITYARDIDRIRKNQPLRSDDYWLAPLLGVDFLDDVYFFDSHRVSDEEFKELTGLKNLRRIAIEDSQVSDVGLAHVAQVQNLECLWLDGTQITDAGLKHLAHQVNLKQLGLSRTNVSDAGVASLNKLRDLDNLELNGTQITDAGIEHLKLLRKLKYLRLYDTGVTPKGILDLQRVLPNCQILPTYWSESDE
jgi:Leucine-rich repeat (LRR) protein